MRGQRRGGGGVGQEAGRGGGGRGLMQGCGCRGTCPGISPQKQSWVGCQCPVWQGSRDQGMAGPAGQRLSAAGATAGHSCAGLTCH